MSAVYSSTGLLVRKRLYHGIWTIYRLQATVSYMYSKNIVLNTWSVDLHVWMPLTTNQLPGFPLW